LTTTAPRHLALVGPTASGKSDLAIAAARCLGDVEIVSADSMQVYRGMDIGTAKTSLEQRQGVTHHLLDVADPSKDYSLARFQAQSREAIEAIEGRGRRALVVGGTGLYVQAVVDGLTMPGSWPQVRTELENIVAQDGTATLYRRLMETDPLAASRMEPSNARRLVRALEVTIGSGRPFSAYGAGIGAYPATRFAMVGLWLSRAVIGARIADRFRDQMAAGWLDEVAYLAQAQCGLSRTARQALGYRELLTHLEIGRALDSAVAEAVIRTQRFARRQRAWFRRDPRITWMATPSNAVGLLPALLGQWSK